MDERKREKQEEKIARDRVKAQIEADKLARKKLYGQASAEEQPKQVLPIAVSPQKQTKDYTETKLQVNMLNTHIGFYILVVTYCIFKIELHLLIAFNFYSTITLNLSTLICLLTGYNFQINILPNHILNCILNYIFSDDLIHF